MTGSHIALLRADGTFDRSAILRLALAEYRATRERKGWGACQSWAWKHARRQRAALRDGRDDRRVDDMLAHHIDHQRRRVAAPRSKAIPDHAARAA